MTPKMLESDVASFTTDEILGCRGVVNPRPLVCGEPSSNYENQFGSKNCGNIQNGQYTTSARGSQLFSRFGSEIVQRYGLHTSSARGSYLFSHLDPKLSKDPIFDAINKIQDRQQWWKTDKYTIFARGSL